MAGLLGDIFHNIFRSKFPKKKLFPNILFTTITLEIPVVCCGNATCPNSSSVQPHTFDVWWFYRQIVGTIEPGLAGSCYRRLLCTHGTRSVNFQMRLVKPHAVGTRLKVTSNFKKKNFQFLCNYSEVTLKFHYNFSKISHTFSNIF